MRNGQNDIIGIVNSSGSSVVSYIYDSWGKLISTTGTLATTIGVINPYRYRGYRYDVETGLYYVTSRYYDPNIGRFLNADAMVSSGTSLLGTNMFAYCQNNCVTMVDSSGYIATFNTMMADTDYDLVKAFILPTDIKGVVYQTPIETTRYDGGVTAISSKLYFADKDSADNYIIDKIGGNNFEPITSLFLDSICGIAITPGGAILLGFCDALKSSWINVYRSGLREQLDQINSEAICIEVIIWDNPRGLSETIYYVSEWK